jgi:hypothetical protein
MTTLFSTCVDITEKVIKQQTITAASLPILATLHDTSGADITSALFGISSLPLDASYWDVTGNTLQNQLDINFGEGLIDYADPIFLRLTTSDGIIVANAALSDTTVETGSELTLYSGTGVTLTLDFGTATLSNAILNLLFKGTASLFPSALSAKYYDNSDTLQATIALTSAKWSKRGIGTLGEIFFEYGNTQTLPSINSTINLARITDASNNIWFEADVAIPTTLKPSAVIFSNSLVLRIPDVAVDLMSYVSPSNSSSLLHLDFNGRLSDQSSNSKISSFASIEYESENKLFGTECLVASASTSIFYEGVVFPNEFTLNAFIYFNTNPSGRLVALAEKNGVFKLVKNAANSLEVSVNGSVVITTPWSPVTAQWQHLWIQKSATTLSLRVNSADINVTTAYTTTITTNSNLFSVCSGILGLCNGIYLEDGLSAFSVMSQPLPRRVSAWDDISVFTWLNLEFPQLKKFF